MAAGWPFVGRHALLDKLTAVLAADTCVLLVGEPGIGKSALAAQLAARLASSGRPTGTVSGQALSGRVPFEAFAAFLSPDEPGPHAVPAERTPADVAEDVATALAAGHGDRAVLVVDDVQGLDAASTQVLQHLVQGGRAVLVMTGPSVGELPAAVPRLVRSGACRMVAVPGLDDQDLVSALELALGAPVDPRTERVFLRRAGGSPLLLRELLAAAQDAQSLSLAEGVWRLDAEPPLAHTVQDLVRGRIAGLPEDHLAALEQVAATEPLPTGVAVQLVGWATLEDLEASHLITVSDDAARSQVTTAPPVLGDVIRADLPVLRLRRLRMAGAAALEEADRPSPPDLVRAALWRLDQGERGDPHRLLEAARVARGIGLELSERLARAALAAGATVQATVLLAEILTHRRRSEEAAELLAALPPETLQPELRDAVVYLDALHRGLLGGDLESAATVVAGAIAGAIAGETGSSDRLHAIHSSFLALDARYEEALVAGERVAVDPAAEPETRAIAAMGVVGAHYWLGHGRRSVGLADDLLPVADTAREALPYAGPAIELLAICALIDDGALAAAHRRAVRMSEAAAERADPFALPRAEYCVGRVHLARGRTGSAARLFRRCVSALTPFDRTFTRHLQAMIARSEALAGDVAAARAALDVGDVPNDMPPYQPDWALAEAAVSAAELDLGRAADHAGYAAGVAASRSQWTTALYACHDAARYGAARAILPALRVAAARTDAAQAGELVSHAEALADDDPRALDELAGRFAAAGWLALAVEASMSAATSHARHGDRRASRASTLTADRLRRGCERLAFPWLVGFAGAVPLTPREREVATLARAGWSDAAMAARLGISVRTIQTHLAHVYEKVGIHARRELAGAVVEPGPPV